ncbi:hypothetical protein SYNPS1DRAFT_20939 [Syncephalis pseudoplumigaleata]|uniref:RNI-like protein n=1 Tax=Syncephalis pseudoplumigaleata TaxID=1712513 RepID=A0A4P9Z4X5_9FUNG|nr:hypothetical protein SYNPS1DRAFT_20939 [Syncephalis pseudoplumigaleata]|eukprot:RKP27566.1 hypothetical protein SYNPS1DRAFT_20939 [Syncephalis pseudoplumigaleata]
MVWGNSDNQAAVDGWIHRLRTNDPHFVSLHIMAARRLTTDQFAQLFAALAHNHTLTQLYCSGHAQSDASLTALADALSQYNHTLQSLTLGDPQLVAHASNGVQALCTAIGINKSLQLLDWSHCGLGTAEDEAVAGRLGQSLENMLARSSSLSEVVLSHNALDDTMVKHVVAGVRANGIAQGALTSLDLSYNELGPDAITSLASALVPAIARTPKHGLHELNLAGNPGMGVAGMAQLGCTLARPESTCRKIVLSDCHAATTTTTTDDADAETGTKRATMGDAFLAALSETSSDVSAATLDLEEIKLDRCAVTVAGARHLAQLLGRPGNRLCEMTLRGNALGDEGARQLAVPIVPLPDAAQGHTITASITGISLDLSENAITDDGLAALLVSDASSIAQLILYGNQIALSEAFVKRVAAAWTSPQAALTLLDLSGNKIDTAGFERLADALIAGALPRLCKLELAGNVDVTKDEAAKTAWRDIAARITDARPQLVLLWC